MTAWTPSWCREADDPRAACRSSIDQWVRSRPFLHLVKLFGGDPGGLQGKRLLAYLDMFSAQHWDFRAGRERNLVKVPQVSRSVADAVLEDVRELGLIAGTKPSRRQYDSVLVMGGLVRACIARTEYAVGLLESGLATKELAALGALRALAGDELAVASRLGLGSAATEFSALTWSLEHTLGPLGPVIQRESGEAGSPEGRFVDYIYLATERDYVVRAMAAPSSDALRRRANTWDNLEFWADRALAFPPAGSVLLVTNAIYAPYQGSVAVESLGVGRGMSVETVGISGGSSLLGADVQTFKWYNYLQELRSAIRGVRSLYGRLDG